MINDNKRSGHNSSLHSVGRDAEEKFVQLAAQRGLAVECHARKCVSYDCVVNGLRVQVKHRQTLANGTVTLLFRRRIGAVREAYCLGEFDVLAMRCDGEWYLIPADALDAGNGETMINRLAPPRFRAHIDNWSVFESDGQKRSTTQIQLQMAWGE